MKEEHLIQGDDWGAIIKEANLILQMKAGVVAVAEDHYILK